MTKNPDQSKPSAEEVRGLAPIMQNQIDTLQATVQCLTTQRNATLDSLTSAQVASSMKNTQINKMNDQITELSKELEKAKSLSSLWNERYDQMAKRSAALVWYIEQLLVEIPDSNVDEVSEDIIASVIASHAEHQQGIKQKENALRVAQKVKEAESEHDRGQKAPAVEEETPIVEETPVVELSASLAKKADTESKKQSLRDADKVSASIPERKVKS